MILQSSNHLPLDLAHEVNTHREIINKYFTKYNVTKEDRKTYFQQIESLDCTEFVCELIAEFIMLEDESLEYCRLAGLLNLYRKEFRAHFYN